MDTLHSGTRTTPRAGIDAKAAVPAGIIAGTVFMMLEMLMVPMFLGGSPGVHHE